MYKQHTLHNGRVIFEKEVVEVLGDECGETSQRQSCDSIQETEHDNVLLGNQRGVIVYTLTFVVEVES